jgi:hypothetical protein
MSRRERATFNLDLVEGGWAAPFIIYPAVPGEADLPLLVGAANTARTAPRGIWADDQTLLAYEYRAMEKLHRITNRLVAGESLGGGGALAWRERYCVDLRTRTRLGQRQASRCGGRRQSPDGGPRRCCHFRRRAPHTGLRRGPVQAPR